MREQPVDVILELGFVIAGVLHQVDAGDLRLALGMREVVAHRIPDDVAHRQVQHLGVDRLDRGRPPGHQCLGVTQRGLEAGVFDIDQCRELRNRQHIQLGLGNKGQRALGPAEHRVEVETPALVADMDQVVTGQAAVELGEPRLDVVSATAMDLVYQPVHFADPVIARLDPLQFGIVEGLGFPEGAIEQHRAQLQHVIAGLAVEAGALAAGVGVDHAANGGAVAGRQLRCEEQAMGLERGIQLVLDHPALYPHPALLGVDLEDPVHVLGAVDDQAIGQRLAVGTGATTTRAQADAVEARLGRQPGDQHQVLGAGRIEYALGQQLIDAVIGRLHHAVGIIRADIATEAQGLELLDKGEIQRFGRVGVGNTGDHGVLEPRQLSPLSHAERSNWRNNANSHLPLKRLIFIN
ncbi:hypothetical protein D9M68_370170 [compost metagenome]